MVERGNSSTYKYLSIGLIIVVVAILVLLFLHSSSKNLQSYNSQNGFTSTITQQKYKSAL